MQSVENKLKQMIETNDVILFMKGSATFPQCGFSSLVVQVLNKLSVNFVAVNVLEDMDIREGIKQYSDWPTIPQLYIKQEFIGGSDIVKEMFESGELEELLKEKAII
jgi:monothiol glutaredoxin